MGGYMIVLITGGSGSGKSEYGENLALKLNTKGKMTYIATMYPHGEETHLKIKRHKEMRKGKGFETLECFYGLKDLKHSLHSTVLLECLSNLLANELYSKEGAREKALEEIMAGIKKISCESEHLIMISNDVFSDILPIDQEMQHYTKLLGTINQEIGELADVVIEVVYSIPIFHKGEIK
jgi:adenosylcobinamide kinase/adenosylcobinamide-phosphate guanylyltransferase